MEKYFQDGIDDIHLIFLGVQLFYLLEASITIKSPRFSDLQGLQELL